MIIYVRLTKHYWVSLEEANPIMFRQSDINNHNRRHLSQNLTIIPIVIPSGLKEKRLNLKQGK